MSENKNSRAEDVRKRREQESKRKVVDTKVRVNTPAPRPVVTRSTQLKRIQPPAAAYNRQRRKFNTATMSVMPASRGGVRTVAVSEIEMGSRWISGGLALLSIALMVFMYIFPPFLISGVELRGAQRIGAGDVNSVLGLMNQSAVLAMPEQIESNLTAIFPEFATVNVTIGFPAQVYIEVTERVPALAWQYNNQMSWIDTNGVAFPARGAAENVIAIMALGNPPTQADANQIGSLSTARAFIAPDTVLAAQTLSAYMPGGTVLMFDPKYGLGWSDPRGWRAFFGTSGTDIALKLQVYQAMVENLMKRSIQPAIISVEYPNAPFYRMEP